MQSNLLAAAGLAEAAWAMAMIEMGGGLLVIAFFGFLTLVLRSRKLAIASLLLLALFCLYYQPWYCFTPFEPTDYDDPDVVSASNGFRFIGMCWIATSALVLIATIIAWFSPVTIKPVEVESVTDESVT